MVDRARRLRGKSPASRVTARRDELDYTKPCPRCAATGVLWGGKDGLVPTAICPRCGGWGWPLKPEGQNDLR